MSERTGISLPHMSLIKDGRLAVTIQVMGALADTVGCPLSTLVEVADKLPANADHPGARLNLRDESDV